MSSTTACLSREIHKWLQSLDLSYAVKNVRRDFASGYLVAEILSRYYKGEVQLSAFDTGSNSLKRKANWTILKRVFNKYNIPITDSQIRNVIFAQPGAVLPIIEQLYSSLTQRPLRVMRPVEEAEVVPSFAGPTAHTSIIRRLNAPDMKHNRDIATAEARAREALEQHNKKAHEQAQQLRATLTLATARQQYAMRSAQRNGTASSNGATMGYPEDSESFSGDQTVRFERVQVKQVVEEQLRTSPSEQKSISGASAYLGDSATGASAALATTLPRASATAPKWGMGKVATPATSHGNAVTSLSTAQIHAGVTGTLGAIFAATKALTSSLIAIGTATQGSSSASLREADVIAARNYFADVTMAVQDSSALGARSATFDQIAQFDVHWGDFAAQDKVVTAVLEALATKTVDETQIASVLERLLPDNTPSDQLGADGLTPGASLLELATSSPMQFWTYLGFLISVIGACAADHIRHSPATSCAIRLIASLATATKSRVGSSGLTDLIADYGVPKLCSLAVTTPVAISSIAAALLALFSDRAQLAVQIGQQLRISTSSGPSMSQISAGTGGLAPEVVSALINAVAAQDPLSHTPSASSAYLATLEAATDGIVDEISMLRTSCQEGKMSEEELVGQLEARIGGLAVGINGLATVVLRLAPNSGTEIFARALDAVDRCSVLAEELVSDTFEAYSNTLPEPIPEACIVSNSKSQHPAPLGRWVNASHAFIPPRGARQLPLGHVKRHEAALRDSVALAISLVKFHAIALSRADLTQSSALSHVQTVDRIFALATVYGVPFIPAVGGLYLLAHPTLLVAAAISKDLVMADTSAALSNSVTTNGKSLAPAVTELLVAGLRSGSGAAAVSAITAHPLVAALVGIVSGCHSAYAFTSSGDGLDAALGNSIDTLNALLPAEFTDDTSDKYLMTAASLTSRRFVSTVRACLLNSRSPLVLIEGGISIPSLVEVADAAAIVRAVSEDTASVLSSGQLQLVWTCLAQITGYPAPYGPVVSAVALEQVSSVANSLESLIPAALKTAETNPSAIRDALAVLGMTFIGASLGRVARTLLQETGTASLCVLANKLASTRYCASPIGAKCVPHLISFFKALLNETPVSSTVRNILRTAARAAQPSPSSSVESLLAQ